MPALAQAHLQQNFRTLTGIFLAAVGITFGTVIYIGAAGSTVTVTPIKRTIPIRLELTIGPAGEGIDLPGKVTQEKKSTTITTRPAQVGPAVAAKARGTVILHNDTDQEETLTSGVRLESANGVIVRTSARAIVPAGGTVSLEATADVAGTAGEIAPGRLKVVALDANSQKFIYGEVQKAFTGGMTNQAGTLGVDELTQASNDGQTKILQEIGSPKAGVFLAAIPDEVGIEPDADIPSNTYDVTVTVIAITATYSADELQQRLASAAQYSAADDGKVISIDTPKLAFEQQPSSDRLIVSISANATTSLRPDSPVLKTSAMSGKPQAEVIQSLLGTTAVKSVDIKIQPFWKTTLPTDPRKIKVQLQPAELDPVSGGS